MFWHIVQHGTGMVRTLRQRFQTSSGPAKGKHTATMSTKKPTKRKQSPVLAVKKAYEDERCFLIRSKYCIRKQRETS